MYPNPCFAMPEDGWYHISASGEFPHQPTGLVQVIDADSLRAIVQKFAEEATKPNFPGILIDFDHSSLDQDKPSEAAGWIVNLDQRPNGLWAQVRWSDRGEEAVRGGRYRFISPVWRQDECMDLGNSRVRPTRLINCAVTNDPNIKGLVPLSNSAPKPRLIACRSVPRFEMGVLLANVMPAEALTDDQRRAMFARFGHGGAGGGGAPRMDYAPSRQSDARIQELRRQRDHLEGLRVPPPEKTTYEQTDTRKLRWSLLHAGMGINDIQDAVSKAAQINSDHREALRSIKAAIRKKYVDPSQRKKALQKQFDQQDKENDRAMRAWGNFNAQIDKQVRRIDSKIAEEQIVASENAIRAGTRENNAAAKTAQQEEERAFKAAVAADKEAKRLAEKQAKDADRQQQKAAREAKTNDPARVYRSELNRRATYWTALARGDEPQARAIYPNADHEKNKADLQALVPPSQSKANQVAYERAMKQLRYMAP